MPRYFFHVRDGQQFSEDTDGQDLPDDRRAHREAVRALAEIAAEKIPRDGDALDLTVQVIDQAGAQLFAATLAFRVTFKR